ncbi:MAG: Hsp70 family protein, partial [Chloroflexi bacterium]|nr:Hsp70 family protein [Chloroflexota bacterium]
EQRIVIQAASGLTMHEIEGMRREAEAHASEDARRREEVEIRNSADSAAYAAEKTLREHGERAPADLRAKVEARIKELRDALAQNAPADRLRQLVALLSQEVQEIGAAIYQAAGTASGPQGPSGQKPGGDAGTVEGEFREV